MRPLKRLSSEVGKRATKVRNKPVDAALGRIDLGRRNIGQGKGMGAVGAGLAVILEDVLGIPFGASVDTHNVEYVQDGEIYTVDVNAPFHRMADARSMIDTSTGFTGFITDDIEILETELIKARPIRDTYRVKVKIHDV